jgi:hypothetical protein
MKGEIEALKGIFGIHRNASHRYTSRIDGTRGSEREFVSDLDTIHLSTDCSLSERDDKIAQA